MVLVKCKKCGNDISTNAEKCVHCGTPVEQLLNVDDVLVQTVSKSDLGSGEEKNYNFFFKLAKVIRILLFILAGLVALVFFIASEGYDEALMICGVVSGIFLVLVAILSTPFIEWKAYMLKNLYELNKKGSK